MSGVEIAEYGFWKSPITAEAVAGESIRIQEPRIEGGSIYWLEMRPRERGRSALVRRDRDGTAKDVLESPWSVRSTVHEYGGGAYAVAGRTAYFTDAFERRAHAVRMGAEPVSLTPAGLWRYADFVVDRRRERLVAVREDHCDPEREAEASIVGIDLRPPGGQVAVLVSGADFYSNPCISPDGSRICWLQWRHPNMPWDSTELWVGALAGDGAVEHARLVAGGPEESVFQPEWSPDGVLHFVSDRTGYWNLYRWSGGRATLLHGREAEFGQPQWIFGQSTYGFASDGSILSSYCEQGRWRLGVIDERGCLSRLESPFTQIESVVVNGIQAVLVAAAPTRPPELVRLDLEAGEFETLRRSAAVSDDLRAYFTQPRPMLIESQDGEPSHGHYYPPRNPDFVAPSGEKPPLIVRLHGGPTAAVGDGLSLTTQFWTSRGFAILDLNYGGSTGFGRAYRERLNGQWGIVDRLDAEAAARHCVRLGLADADRLIVKGGSAGGYSVLCCLAYGTEFAAGASYYGIGNLLDLVRSTHKFESRYLDRLIGPLPDSAALYEERSPLHAVDRVTSPVAFFQGSIDPVVPKDQTEAMVEALRRRSVPVTYYLFDGESHGFKRSRTIRVALEAELAFYCTVLLRKGVRC